MKKILIVLGIVSIIGFCLYFYLYQEHRDINKEEATANVSSVTLVDSFKKNFETSNKKYLDKTITVSGVVTSVDIKEKYLVLDGKINCYMIDKNFPKVNDKVLIKGRFILFDDLLEEVKIDQSSVVQ